MSTPEDREFDRKDRRLGRIVLTIFGLIVCLLVVAVGMPKIFGRQIHGSVTCENSDVTGVSVEAKYLSAVLTKPSHWNEGGNIANFDYWLSYGGEYAVILHCAPLPNEPAGSGGTSNRTEKMSAVYPRIQCDNPPNDTGKTILVQCTPGIMHDDE